MFSIGYKAWGAGWGVTRKMYCHSCGRCLKKEKYATILSPGDKYYMYYAADAFPFDATVVMYQYSCANCQTKIPYEKQVKIEKFQKKFGRLILTKEELETYSSRWVKKAYCCHCGYRMIAGAKSDYKCPNCRSIFFERQQSKIRKLQKRLKKLILTDEELNTILNQPK